jgi:hypothetical protein
MVMEFIAPYAENNISIIGHLGTPWTHLPGTLVPRGVLLCPVLCPEVSKGAQQCPKVSIVSNRRVLKTLSRFSARVLDTLEPLGALRAVTGTGQKLKF